MKTEVVLKSYVKGDKDELPRLMKTEVVLKFEMLGTSHIRAEV